MGIEYYKKALAQFNAMVLAPARVPITDFEAWAAREEKRPHVTCVRCDEVDAVFDDTGLPPGFEAREDGPICGACVDRARVCPTCGQHISKETELVIAAAQDAPADEDVEGKG